MEKNPIDKLFEDKLTDYTSTPSVNLWDRIEKQIPYEQKEEKSFLRRFWWLCLLLFIPMSIGIWYMSYEKNTTQKSENMATYINTQKLVDIENNETKNIINSGKKESEEKIEETKNNLIQKDLQNSENKEFSINQKKNEKNIQSEATSEKEISSTNQKAEENEVKQNSNEKTEEKVKEETKKIDTAKPQPAKKGVKVIIKLSEPEEPKEGKARDFASTKTGKFLRKLKQIKEGETGIPPVQIPLN
ncbi:hypothetical protein AD998_08710 [bacterium 336/3]|nr:hypothetical protein AD998_08710 [bacterium 336/3]